MPALIALALVGPAFAAAVFAYIPGRKPETVSAPPDILDVIAREGVLRSESWQLEPSHRAPLDPYTPEQAHAAMQQHVDCGTDICRAKYAAFWLLVDEGLVVPDARAVR